LHSSFFEVLELFLALDLEELEIKFWPIFKKFMERKNYALFTSNSLPSLLVDVKIMQIEINNSPYKKRGDLFSTILEDKILKHSPNSSPLEINSHWNCFRSKIWFKEVLIV
jgi:hypothetical protein